MSVEEFVDLVTRMRLAQRAYSSLRNMRNLIAAKELERAVDAAVLRFGESRQLTIDGRQNDHGVL